MHLLKLYLHKTSYLNFVKYSNWNYFYDNTASSKILNFIGPKFQ